MSLDVNVHDDVDEVLIVLDGEMDTHTSAMVGERLNLVIGSRRVSIVVGAVALRFVDSSGISEPLRLRQRTIDGETTLRVRSASPAVRRVLEITGFLELLGLE